ncbi:MAG: hypothetical protein J6D29_04845 [Solobacterium sp.]|nr:hypothetical protein [Solobacterium sp.]
MKAIIIVEIPDEFKKSYADITIFEDEPPYGITERIEYLKPLPRKKDINIAEKKKGFYEIYSKNYVQGWNDCLYEILGEDNV